MKIHLKVCTLPFLGLLRCFTSTGANRCKHYGGTCLRAIELSVDFPASTRTTNQSNNAKETLCLESALSPGQNLSCVTQLPRHQWGHTSMLTNRCPSLMTGAASVSDGKGVNGVAHTTSFGVKGREGKVIDSIDGKAGFNPSLERSSKQLASSTEGKEFPQ